MVVIRLSRGGAKKRPFFHVVVSDKRDPRDGRCIERVGYFNPSARGKDIPLHMNLERIRYWMSTGAQPSDRVQSLLKAAVKAAATAETAQ
jgi:small subunit ribosomal protein S16